MIYFKTIASVVFPFMVTLFVSYLIGSFMNTSFNPVDWTIESRQFMSLAGLLFGLALYGRLHWENLV